MSLVPYKNVLKKKCPVVNAKKNNIIRRACLLGPGRRARARGRGWSCIRPASRCSGVAAGACAYPAGSRAKVVVLQRHYSRAGCSSTASVTCCSPPWRPAWTPPRASGTLPRATPAPSCRPCRWTAGVLFLVLKLNKDFNVICWWYWCYLKKKKTH